MGNAHGNFIWYELMAADLDAQRAFYEAVIGWRIDGDPQTETGMDYRMVAAGETPVAGAFQLTPDMIDGGARTGWMGYVAVEDVDATLAAMAADGATVTMPAHDIPGIGRMAMISDPQGAPLYLMTPTPPGGDPDAVSRSFDPDAIGHCAWNELSTSDPSAALTFYQKHFGWTKGTTMPMGDMGDYQLIEHDGRETGAVMSRMTDGPPPLWHFYWHLADIDAAKTRIEAEGGTVMHGPAEVPGDEFIIVATDSQGAMFSVLAPRKGG